MINPWGPAGPGLLHYKEMISSQNLGEKGLEGFYKALEDSLHHVQHGNEILNLQAVLENHFDRTFTASEEEDEARNMPEGELVQATQFLQERGLETGLVKRVQIALRGVSLQELLEAVTAMKGNCPECNDTHSQYRPLKGAEKGTKIDWPSDQLRSCAKFRKLTPAAKAASI